MMTGAQLKRLAELESNEAIRELSLRALGKWGDPVRLSTDTSGHAHKENGPGGGQFTSKGNGSGPSKTSESPRESGTSARKAVAATRDDAAKVAKHAIASKPLTPQEAAAVDAYRNTRAVWDINNYCRGKPSLTQRVMGLGGKNKQIVADLDRAIAKSVFTDDATVMRGMKIPKGAAEKMFATGATFTDKGFCSTSLAGDVAKQFATTYDADNEQVMIAIHVPKGSNGYAMPRVQGELQFDEAEVVLPRGSQFRVHSVTRDDDRNVVVQMELVPAHANEPANIKLSQETQSTAGEPIEIARLERFVWSADDLQRTTDAAKKTK